MMTQMIKNNIRTGSSLILDRFSLKRESLLKSFTFLAVIYTYVNQGCNSFITG